MRAGIAGDRKGDEPFTFLFNFHLGASGGRSPCADGRNDVDQEPLACTAGCRGDSKERATPRYGRPANESKDSGKDSTLVVIMLKGEVMKDAQQPPQCAPCF